MPNQKQRQKGVRAKLNPMKKKFEGKNVLLVDDSIVRGTTSREIVLMAREAGAKKVIYTSCAPEITYPHIYGIDLASRDELIAHARSSVEIAKVIGADAMVYQTLEDLKEACAELSPRPNQQFEVGIFCGKYVTPVKDAYFDHLDALRGVRAREQKIELARQAVVQGTADGNDAAIAIAAAASTTVNKKDKAELQQFVAAINPTNGVGGINGVARNGTDAEEEPPSPRRMQDMSLHNLNDHADER